MSDLSNVNYSQIVEYSLDPIIIHTNLKIIYINQAAAAFLEPP